MNRKKRNQIVALLMTAIMVLSMMPTGVINATTPEEKKGVPYVEELTGDMNRLYYNNPDLIVDLDNAFCSYPVVVNYNNDYDSVTGKPIMDLLVWAGSVENDAYMIYYGIDSADARYKDGITLEAPRQVNVDAEGETISTNSISASYEYDEDGKYVQTLLHIGGEAGAYDATAYPHELTQIVSTTGSGNAYQKFRVIDGNESFPEAGTAAAAAKIQWNPGFMNYYVDYNMDGQRDAILCWDSYYEYGWRIGCQMRYDKNGIWGGVEVVNTKEVDGQKVTYKLPADGDNDPDKVKDGDPLHGWAAVTINNGTNEAMQFADNSAEVIRVYDYTGEENSKKILEGTDKALDVYGNPSTLFADWDGDSDLDIVTGCFLDDIMYFENIAEIPAGGFPVEDGSYKPIYVKGRPVQAVVSDAATETSHDLQVGVHQVVPTMFDWNGDGHMDLIVGNEDGRVFYIENTGTLSDNVPVMKDPVCFQTYAQTTEDGVTYQTTIDYGALGSVDSIDWDGDGDEDLVLGDDEGCIKLLPNLTKEKKGDLENPIWGKAIYLTNASGEQYRIKPGYNGSLQGPDEENFGYNKITVGDWDGDGMLDIISNQCWGIVMFHKGIKTTDGTFQAEEPKPIEVEWSQSTLAKYDGYAPHPDWNWWNPGEEPLNQAYTKETTHGLDYEAILPTWQGNSKELVVQWRTSPLMIDLPLDKDGDGVAEGDGLMDLVVLDHEGYLSFFERYVEGGVLKLKEGQRIFYKGAEGTWLRTREATLVDGQSGRDQFTLADYNGDGKLDFIANNGTCAYCLYNEGNAGEYLFEKTKGYNSTLHPRKLANHVPSPTTCDWDRDGRLELLVAAEGGNIYYLNNKLPSAEEFKYVKPGNYGITEGTYTHSTSYQDIGRGTTALESLDKVVYNVNIDAGGRWQLFYTNIINMTIQQAGTKNEYIRLFLSGVEDKKPISENLPHGYMDIFPMKAIGETSFIGHSYRISISTEYVDYHGDGLKNDVKMGIWFNGKLYDETYIYLTQHYVKDNENGTIQNGSNKFRIEDGCINNLTKTAFIRLNAGTGTEQTTIFTAKETIPTNFTKISPATYNLADNTYTKDTTGTNTSITSLDKVLYEMTVLANAGGFFYSFGDQFIFFQYADSGTSLRLWPQGFNGDDIHLDYNGTTASNFHSMSVQNAFSGKRSSFYSQEYDFAISTEYVNYDKKTDEQNDLKIGIWFDGALYGNEYFYYTNCVSFLTPQKIMIRGAAGGYTVHSPKTNSDFEGFTRVTLKDFGFEDDTYQEGSFYPSKTPISTWDKVIFETEWTPSTTYYNMYWGGSLDGSKIHFQYRPDGYYRLFESFTESFDNNGLTYIDLTPSSVGKSAFINTTYTLSITTEYVDHDGNGEKNDLKLGIWVDHKLRNDSYVYVKDGAKELQNNVWVKGGAAASCTLASTSNLNTERAISITDSVEMQYTIKPEQFATKMGDVTPMVSFEMGDKSTKPVKMDVLSKIDGTYAFSYPDIMMQDLDETIKAKVTIGTYSETIETSVLDYCVDVLEADTLTDADGALTAEELAKVKELVVDLVQNATAVQVYRGVAESELLTTKLATKVANYVAFDKTDEDASALATLEGVVATADKVKLDNGIAASEAYKWKSVGLVLGNKVEIRARFKADDVSKLTVKAFVGTEEIKIKYEETSEAGVYVFDFNDIYAYEYATEIAFKFYENGTQVGNTLRYSVNTYLNAMEDNNTANLQDLLVAIHNYGLTADAYRTLTVSAVE